MGLPEEARPASFTTEVVRYGIVRDDSGTVEHFGTKPDGTTGYFTEDEARYLASRQTKDKRVLKSVTTHTRTHSEWEEV